MPGFEVSCAVHERDDVDMLTRGLVHQAKSRTKISRVTASPISGTSRPRSLSVDSEAQRPGYLRAGLWHRRDVRELRRDLRLPPEPRLLFASPSPLRPHFIRDLLVWNPGSRRNFVAATIHCVDDVQPVLDIRDGRVIRQVVNEMLQDLLRRGMRHTPSMP
jgi:hypothetical protein